MTTTHDTAGPVPETAAPRQRSWARRGPIAAAGGFSLIAGALVGTYWIRLHRAVWEGGSFSLHGLYRHVPSAVALVAGIVVTTILTRIALAPGVRSRTAAYWMASLVLWFALGFMSYVGLAGESTPVGFFP